MTAADAGIVVAAGVAGIAIGWLVASMSRRGMRERLLAVGTRLGENGSPNGQPPKLTRGLDSG